MTEIAETVSNQIESQETSRLNTAVAVVVSITAVLMAIFNIKDNNIVQTMSLAQSHSIDAWSYYQAKSTKQSLAENMKDNLELQILAQPNLSAQAKSKIEKALEQVNQKIQRYEKEKAEIKAQAEGFQKEYDDLNIHDDQFDMAEALMSISIAIFGIVALTRRRPLFFFGLGLSLLGLTFGMAGFLGWNLHPEWLAKLLG